MCMQQLSTLKKLLLTVSRLDERQKKFEKDRGETFNLFSVLNLERKEIRTHSAFIKELLDPQGSHLKGTVFLELFLKEINATELDLSSTVALAEFPIGNINDEDKTGGRIDILLQDASGNHVCIENKIDAVDGNNQIERYVNYKFQKNTVYYLTLFGDEPAAYSRGALDVKKHFHVISYNHHILRWLEVCLKVTMSPFLAVPIQQYLILVRKLTGTMDNPNEKDLCKLLSQNLSAASLVVNNFNEAKVAIAESVRLEVFRKIEKFLSVEWLAHKDDGMDKRYAQIVIYKERPTVLTIHLQGFNTISPYDDLFLGMYNGQNKQNIFTKPDLKSQKWYQKEYIQVDGRKLNFKDPDFLGNLYTDKLFRRKVIKEIIRHTKEYFFKYEYACNKTGKKNRSDK